MNSSTIEIARRTGAKRYPKAIEFPDMGLAPAAGGPAGVLVLLRAESAADRLLWPYLYCDDVPVAHTEDQTYFSVRLTPGRHTMRTDFTEEPFDLEVKAGETLYLQLKTARRGITPYQKLEQMASEEAATEIKTLEPMTDDRISPKYR